MKSRCSICGQFYIFDYRPGDGLPRHFPFCSQRCKAVDLGKWLDGEYRISISLPNSEIMTTEEKKILAQYLLAEGEVDEVIGNEEIDEGDCA